MRMHDDLLEMIDEFIAQSPEPMTRPEAIRLHTYTMLHLMKNSKTREELIEKAKEIGLPLPRSKKED